MYGGFGRACCFMFKPSTLLQCVTEQNIGLPGSKKYDPNKLSVSISSKWLMIVRGLLNSIICRIFKRIHKHVIWVNYIHNNKNQMCLGMYSNWKPQPFVFHEFFYNNFLFCLMSDNIFICCCLILLMHAWLMRLLRV